MRHVAFASIAIAAAFVIAGCQQQGEQPTPDTSMPVATAAAVDESGSGKECGGKHAGGKDGGACDKKKGGGECPGKSGAGSDSCGADSTKLANDEVVTRKDAQGRTVMHAGEEFSGVAKVTVADLLAKPDQYQGKSVELEGNISTMCTHRRGWFALVGDDKSGMPIRVLTAPTFLVPQGSIGKTARVEGTVDTIELSARMAKHLAEKYKLGDADGDGPIKQVVVRANGADFI